MSIQWKAHGVQTETKWCVKIIVRHGLDTTTAELRALLEAICTVTTLWNWQGCVYDVKRI